MWVVELESEKKLLCCSDTRRRILVATEVPSKVTQTLSNNDIKKKTNYPIFTLFNEETNEIYQSIR
jgi:hypothetical protein